MTPAQWLTELIDSLSDRPHERPGKSEMITMALGALACFEADSECRHKDDILEYLAALTNTKIVDPKAN